MKTIVTSISDLGKKHRKYVCLDLKVYFCSFISLCVFYNPVDILLLRQGVCGNLQLGVRLYLITVSFPGRCQVVLTSNYYYWQVSDYTYFQLAFLAGVRLYLLPIVMLCIINLNMSCFLVLAMLCIYIF